MAVISTASHRGLKHKKVCSSEEMCYARCVITAGEIRFNDSICLGEGQQNRVMYLSHL